MANGNWATGPLDVEESVARLSGMLLRRDGLNELLQQVVELATTTLPAFERASVTLVSDGRPATRAATDELTSAVDNVQYEDGEGPCLNSIKENEIQAVRDTETEERFGKFASHARDFGLGCVLAFPLVAGDRPVGALNLYSTAANALDDEVEGIGTRLAGQAAIAIDNAHVHEEALTLVEQLRVALERRGVIEQAKGILMASRRIDADQAFELLRETSQHQNRKLFDVASEIVRRASEAVDG